MPPDDPVRLMLQTNHDMGIAMVKAYRLDPLCRCTTALRSATTSAAVLAVYELLGDRLDVSLLELNDAICGRMKEVVDATRLETVPGPGLPSLHRINEHLLLDPLQPADPALAAADTG